MTVNMTTLLISFKEFQRLWQHWAHKTQDKARKKPQQNIEN
jgi:hypothetical protein